MPVYEIHNYVLRYDLENQRPWLIIHYKKDGLWRNVNWFPPQEDAQYLSDMLRNEKPVFYVETEGGRHWLTTSAEPIGEEESTRSD